MTARYAMPINPSRAIVPQEVYMLPPLARVESDASAAFRVVAGLLFLFHGLQKLFGICGGTQMPLASQMGLSGVIELVGGAR